MSLYFLLLDNLMPQNYKNITRNTTKRNKKVPLHSAKQQFYVSNGTNYINYANFILMVITALC